jgi:hypothetical protein
VDGTQCDNDGDCVDFIAEGFHQLNDYACRARGGDTCDAVCGRL